MDATQNQKRPISERLQILLTLLFFSMQIIRVLTEWHLPAWHGLLGLGVILIGLRRLRPLSLALYALMLASGTIMFGVAGGEPFEMASYLGSFTRFGDMVAFLTVLGLFRATFEQFDLSGNVGGFLSRMARSGSARFFAMTGMSHLLGSVMLFSAIPISLQIIDGMVAKDQPERIQFINATVTQGYSLAIFWTPISMSLAVILRGTGLSWVQVVPYGVACMLISWVALWLLSGRNVRPLAVDSAYLEPSRSEVPLVHAGLIRAMLTLPAMLLIFIGVEHGMGFPSVTALTLTAVLFPLIWCSLFGKLTSIARQAVKELTDGLLSTTEPILLMLVMGVFTAGLYKHGLDQFITEGIGLFTDQFPLYLLALAIPLLVVMMGMVGVNAVASLVILGDLYQQGAIPVSPLFLAVVLVGSAATTYLVSPFSLLNMIVSTLIRISTFRLAWWNLGYSISVWLIVALASTWFF